MSLRSEIFEQPVVLHNLLAEQFQIVRDIAKVIRAHDVRFIFLAARGTSDNAGRYANYLWGSFNLLPTALATPSLFTTTALSWLPRTVNSFACRRTQSTVSAASIPPSNRSPFTSTRDRPGKADNRASKGASGSRYACKSLTTIR